MEHRWRGVNGAGVIVMWRVLHMQIDELISWIYYS